MRPHILFFVRPEIAEEVQATVESLGQDWRVSVATCARDAFAIADLSLPDVAVVQFDPGNPDVLGFLRWSSERSTLVSLVPNEDECQLSMVLESGVCDFFMWPCMPHKLLARVRSALRLHDANQALAKNRAEFEQRVTQKAEELEIARFEIVQRLAKAAEFRDTETGNHTLRVGAFAKCIAAKLGMSEEYQQRILQAAPLHDIGKIAISDEILFKPGKLSPAEYAEMTRHCEFGYAILTDRITMPGFELGSIGLNHCAGSPFIQLAAIIALQHHEKWDGTGYPNGLSGEDIDLAARIVAVADVYDALRSARPYKASMSQSRSVEILREGAGKHFDPQVVHAFLAAMPRILEIESTMRDESAELKAA